jgi:hypothetical protein
MTAHDYDPPMEKNSAGVELVRGDPARQVSLDPLPIGVMLDGVDLNVGDLRTPHGYDRTRTGN